MAKIVKPTKAEKSEINRRLERQYPGRKYKIKKGFMAKLKGKLQSMYDTRTTAVVKGTRLGNALTAEEAARFNKPRK